MIVTPIQNQTYSTCVCICSIEHGQRQENIENLLASSLGQNHKFQFGASPCLKGINWRVSVASHFLMCTQIHTETQICASNTQRYSHVHSPHPNTHTCIYYTHMCIPHPCTHLLKCRVTHALLFYFTIF